MPISFRGLETRETGCTVPNKMRELVIGKNDGGQRLDKFLIKALPDLPRSLLYKAIRTKKIKVNRKRAAPFQILLAGDCLQLFLREELVERGDAGAAGEELARISPRLCVLYEDENILLLNKPAGVPVHEDESNRTANLLTHLQAYLYQQGEYDPGAEQSFAPALCNRIDRNTAGIVIAAKNAEALRVMNQKIRERQIDKIYLAAVHGTPDPREATLFGYLRRDEKTKTVQVYDRNPPPDAKPIRTRYCTVAVSGGLSLQKIELLTGRTHQIRAHMEHIGHPLLGEGKYGHNREDRARGYAHQALCAFRLRFSFTGEPTALDYLNGRSFSLPPEEVWFLKEFPGADPGRL